MDMQQLYVVRRALAADRALHQYGPDHALRPERPGRFARARWHTGLILIRFGLRLRGTAYDAFGSGSIRPEPETI